MIIIIGCLIPPVQHQKHNKTLICPRTSLGKLMYGGRSSWTFQAGSLISRQKQKNLEAEYTFKRAGLS